MGRTLRSFRDTVGITQKELGTSVGLSQARVSRLERSGDMHISTLTKYAGGLGFRVEVHLVKDDIDATVDFGGE